MKNTKMMVNIAGAFGLAATMNAYQIAPATASDNLDDCRLLESGEASWYGPGFNGKRAASGEIFNEDAMTVAHLNLPFGTELTIRNQTNGKIVEAVVNDRGGFEKYNRILDGSKGVAEALDYRTAGKTNVDLYLC